MTLNELQKIYTKEQIDNAISLLSYHSVSNLPKDESNEHPTMYIFRHGQSQDNAEYIFSGWRDSELTDKGKEQALELSEKFINKQIQMLISSPQKRAIETMKIAMSKNEFASKLMINIDERIKERCYGDFQGKSKLEIQLRNPQELIEIRRSYDFIPPNGESLEMVCKRVKDFCDEIIPLMKQNKLNVAISCHGNSIRGFRKYFENLTDSEVTSIETPLAKDYASYVIK